MYSVDSHAGTGMFGQDTWDEFCANIEGSGVAARVHIRRGLFQDVLPAMQAEGVRVDGCFIDAQHDEECVRRDLGLALPLVKPGGWVAFHDYGRGPHNGFPTFGVTQVADEFGVLGVTGCLAWGRAA